ncbi:MAG: sporulation protein YqfD [Clostridia bacterium]|nr:sporulation protein YqfD [Clostridia bacterium]
MLRLWQFFMGYLSIKINRENSERLLNRAAASKIKIWNLQYKDGYIYGNISPTGFIKLYELRKGIKCKIKIIEKCGLVFSLKRHKKRFGFILGIILFFSIIILLSNFIWIIDIDGNNKITDSQVINSCKEIGIYEGMAKNKINNKYAAQHLQIIRDDIGWCSFVVEGSVLTINLSEIDNTIIKESDYPSNIKSIIEGTIKKINVSSGDALVKVGDTVSKGDLLVSGVVSKADGVHFVHSSGEIIADTYREFSAQCNFKQQKQVETGEIIKRYTIEFFNIKIPLYFGKVNKMNNYNCKINNLKLFGNRLPISVACEEYKIKENLIYKYNKDELKEILLNEINTQVDDFGFISITECEREFVETEKGILLKITYKCEENVAVQENILLSKEN